MLYIHSLFFLPVCASYYFSSLVKFDVAYSSCFERICAKICVFFFEFTFDAFHFFTLTSSS